MSFKDVIATLNGAKTCLLKRYIGPFWQRRQWLAKTQWFSEQELSKLQLKLLKRLVLHSYNTVPYYRKLMEQRGINAESIKTLEDIKLFPILTKKDVLLAGDSIVSTKYPRWLLTKAFTGGTTGTPLVLRRDIFSIGNEHAFVRRQWDWAGVGLTDKCAYLTGRLIVRPDEKTKRLYAYDPIMKELILSTYHLSRHTAKEYACVIKDYGVKAIVGYPSAVCLLAQTCLDADIKLKVSAVLTSSEILTEPMRKTISQAFGCKVFDFYGGAERVCYIFTCEQGNYHILPEYGLTELVPVGDDKKDHYKVIATGFWNMAMPLIRYDMGDIIVKSDNECSCGRQFPTIKSISGRQANSIRTPSGRQFGAAILTHLLYGVDHIAESQIVQDALDHITVNYVPTGRFSDKDLQNFKNLIAKHLPNDLAVTFKQMETIEKSSSGKLVSVVSKIE
jgi:phenylacetate-CoA ligase